MKFAEIRDRIVNSLGFRTPEVVKQAVSSNAGGAGGCHRVDWNGRSRAAKKRVCAGLISVAPFGGLGWELGLVLGLALRASP